MSEATFTVNAKTRGGVTAGPRVGDYVALLKPRVMSLVVFTALAGLVLAPAAMHPVVAFITVLCIAVGAGASGAINMWYDADIDGEMSRTCERPIPSGRIAPGEALGFGVTLAAGSVLMMGLATNWFAAGLLAFTIAFYIFIYTMWLKRRTPHNIVIGGAAGAFPPMIAWAAATGSISVESVALFAIIFMWTPPHFWALALYRSEDYARVRVPMLPVVAGKRETRVQIVLYTLLLYPVTLMPWYLGMTSAVYGLAAGVLGALFVFAAFRVWREKDEQREPAARRMFGYSILYLFLLFALLLGEGIAGWVA